MPSRPFTHRQRAGFHSLAKGQRQAVLAFAVLFAARAVVVAEGVARAVRQRVTRHAIGAVVLLAKRVVLQLLDEVDRARRELFLLRRPVFLVAPLTPSVDQDLLVELVPLR